MLIVGIIVAIIGFGALILYLVYDRRKKAAERKKRSKYAKVTNVNA